MQISSIWNKRRRMTAKAPHKSLFLRPLRKRILLLHTLSGIPEFHHCVPLI
jgi:hypothetical protein